MFTARAFWMTRRSAGLECGSVPPVFTATLISLLMRENALDMRSQRANIVCLRTSNILPIPEFWHATGLLSHAQRTSSRGVCARGCAQQSPGTASWRPRKSCVARETAARFSKEVGLARVADHALEVEMQRVEHGLRDRSHLLVDVVLAIERVLAIVERLGTRRRHHVADEAPYGL